MNRLFRIIRGLILLSLVLSGVFVAVVLYYLEYQLPDIDALNTVQLQVPLQIFSQDQKLIATFGEKRRVPLPYNQIPQPLINAVLATEDQRYFKHAGVDLQGLARAAIQLVSTGRKAQGGSTITMQVARSFYLTRNKTFARKIREILLAIKIEHRLSKEKILELYLNKVFLGNRAYGVEAAAQVYYGKHLQDLTLDQYAMLAGLPKAPSMLNPLANPEAARKRRDHVLARMREQNYIDDLTYYKAINTPLNASYHDIQNEVNAPYVAELVREQLEQKYGESIYTDGFKVYTTIDSKLQAEANTAVRDNVLAYDKRHGFRGASANLGVPSLDNLESWQAELRKIPAISNLEPVAVIEMTNQTVTVLKASGDLTIIPWSGLSWARKQLSADYLGPMPKRAQQIVQLGDIVRLETVGKNSYFLSQIPKAEGSMVALSPQNGAILALAGGFDYKNSKFNRITSALRQPGSSFKPFIYSAALDKGYTLATVIDDAPIVIENPTDNSLWRPQNDTHKFYGPTRIRTALINSRNVVSIRLLDMMGIPYAIDYLKRFGFTQSQLPQGLSLALGTALVTPLQLAQSYAIFANGGLKVVPYVIDIIRNNHDQIIYQAKPLSVCANHCNRNQAAAPRAITPQNAFLVTSALRDVIQRGTARLAKNLGRSDLAGKTGTTQNQVDAWFAGYNPDLVAVSWMGFDSPQSLHEYGVKAALPMWMQFIENALKGKPEHQLDQPEDVVSIRIDPNSGERASMDDSDAIFEYFMLPYAPMSQEERQAMPDDGYMTLSPTDADALTQNNDGDSDNASELSPQDNTPDSSDDDASQDQAALPNPDSPDANLAAPPNLNASADNNDGSDDSNNDQSLY